MIEIPTTGVSLLLSFLLIWRKFSLKNFFRWNILCFDKSEMVKNVSSFQLKENWCKNIWLLSFEQKAGGAATLRHQMSDWFQSIHKLNCSDLRVNTHEVFISPHVIIFDCNHVCWKRLLTRCYFDRIPKVARVRERERKRERKRDREKENRFWLKEK